MQRQARSRLCPRHRRACDRTRRTDRSCDRTGRGESTEMTPPKGKRSGAKRDFMQFTREVVEVFESRVSKYIEARSAAYYRVSTELAAKKNVDMERARNDLEQHKLICIPAAEARPSGPRVLRALSENRSRRLHGTPSFSHAKTISELKETKDPKLRQLFPRDMRCLLAEADRILEGV